MKKTISYFLISFIAFSIISPGAIAFAAGTNPLTDTPVQLNQNPMVTDNTVTAEVTTVGDYVTLEVDDTNGTMLKPPVRTNKTGTFIADPVDISTLTPGGDYVLVIRDQASEMQKNSIRVDFQKPSLTSPTNSQTTTGQTTNTQTSTVNPVKIITDIAFPVAPIKNQPIGSSIYNLLAPIGNLVSIDTSGNSPCPADPSIKNGIGCYLNIIFKLAIGLCGALAVIMIIISSVQYMGDESIFGKTEAKGKIFSSILGLLIALGSYALLNTINPDLLGSKGVTITKVTINIDPDTPQPIPKDGQPYPYTSYKYGDSWPSDANERGILTNLGISVKTNPPAVCSSVGQTSCTSVYQLDNTYIARLKTQCGADCELIITGGTEFWLHGSNPLKVHYPGGWAVDLEETPTLKTYVAKLTKVNLPNWRDGGANCYYDPIQKIGMVDEIDHYHAMNGACDTKNQGNID